MHIAYIIIPCVALLHWTGIQGNEHPNENKSKLITATSWQFFIKKTIAWILPHNRTLQLTDSQSHTATPCEHHFMFKKNRRQPQFIDTKMYHILF